MAARLAMTVQPGERGRSGTLGPDRATRVESGSASSLERLAGRARLAGVTRLAAIRPAQTGQLSLGVQLARADSGPPGVADAAPAEPAK
jgi:hypothetical protein